MVEKDNGIIQNCLHQRCGVVAKGGAVGAIELNGLYANWCTKLKAF